MIVSFNKTALLIYFLISSTSLFCQENWELVSEKDKMKVWTKSAENNPIKQFKLITEAPGSIYQYTNALIDLENLPNWYDKIILCKVEEVLSDKSAKYLLEFNLPWPIRNRYCQMQGEIIYNDSVAIIKTHAYDGDKKTHKSMVRVTEMSSYWKIERNSPLSVTITHKGHFDPAGYLPTWLVNSAVGKAQKTR